MIQDNLLFLQLFRTVNNNKKVFTSQFILNYLVFFLKFRKVTFAMMIYRNLLILLHKTI